ncbi:hypothetical protein ACLOJK_028689 [Asimina triloba]
MNPYLAIARTHDIDLGDHSGTPNDVADQAVSSKEKRAQVSHCIVATSYSDCGIVPIDQWDDKEEGKEGVQQWEDDWDDDDVNDDFSLQLRRELESNTEKTN